MFAKILISLAGLFVSLVIGLSIPTTSAFFYCLSPLLIMVIVYAYSEEKHFFFVFWVALWAALHAYALSHYPSLEISFYGSCSATLILMLGLYSRLWKSTLSKEKARTERVRSETLSLREQFNQRLESLSRLESQVLSLMELFEVARDFSGALRIETLGTVLYEKVLPELPFKRLHFLQIKSGEGDSFEFEKGLYIDNEGVVEHTLELPVRQQHYIREATTSGQLVKKEVDSKTGEEWFFPLLVDQKVLSVVVVEGAGNDDFVKFEVLMAQLVLQIKKIALYEQVLELSIIDDLTGVYVRRYFLERMQEELKRSLSYNLPLTVLMLDIDHFKRYNDHFGHLVGDETLKKVVELMRQNLRKVDIVARYGGEEFIAVLPESQSDAAFEVAERIRSTIARHTFKVYGNVTDVTVSIGIATFPDDIPQKDRLIANTELAFDLIRHADKALYRAKSEGRNQVFQYKDLN